MSRAFLSHSSTDKDVVRKIKERLTRAWTYFDEDCFSAGEDFRKAIISRIENTKLFVLFASEKSLSSDWVNFELDEIYWETIKNRDISVLVLNLENVDISKFPKWMLKAKIESVENIDVSAQIIIDNLLKTVIDNDVYVGRGDETKTFNMDINSMYHSFPNIIAISGLEGVGRRTFAKKAISDRFNLNYFYEIELNDSEGIDEIYRYLINNNINFLSKESIDEELQAFSQLDIVPKCETIASIISDYTSNNTLPIIVDNGGMLDLNGYYHEEFLNIFRIFSKEFKDHYLLLIHKRIPQLSYKDNKLIYNFSLKELSYQDSFTALDILLKRNNIRAKDKNNIEELAKHIDGYPPAIWFAVKECLNYGIDVVCNDKRKLNDFKSGVFSDYLDSISMDEFEFQVLKLVYYFEVLDVATISLLLQTTNEQVSSSLIKFIDYSIISVLNDGYYRISSPIKVAVSRKVSLYSKKEMSTFSRLLIHEFDKDDTKGLFFIDNIVTALLYSDNDQELEKYKFHLLPSKLIGLANKYNIDRDWQNAEKYIRKALTLAPQNLDAKVLLFKLLVRQENKNTSYEKEEEDILEQLDELYDKRRFYLRGFRFWKKHDFNNAIEQFSLGKQAGDDSIPIHRDLAECYFQL